MTADAKTWLHYPLILVTILLVSLSCYLMMRLSHTISARMGTTMMKSFTRIMGFILLCVGVQYIVNGIMPLLREAMH